MQLLSILLGWISEVYWAKGTKMAALDMTVTQKIKYRRHRMWISLNFIKCSGVLVSIILEPEKWLSCRLFYNLIWEKYFFEYYTSITKFPWFKKKLLPFDFWNSQHFLKTLTAVCPHNLKKKNKAMIRKLNTDTVLDDMYKKIEKTILFI